MGALRGGNVYQPAVAHRDSSNRINRGGENSNQETAVTHVPSLNIAKARRMQEKQILAREIIEQDKLARTSGPAAFIKRGGY
jgi:hypothetical protein